MRKDEPLDEEDPDERKNEYWEILGSLPEEGIAPPPSSPFGIEEVKEKEHEHNYVSN